MAKILLTFLILFFCTSNYIMRFTVNFKRFIPYIIYVLERQNMFSSRYTEVITSAQVQQIRGQTTQEGTS
jgi:hypothetical protein